MLDAINLIKGKRRDPCSQHHPEYSPQYARAWKKYVVSDPAYKDGLVSPCALPITSVGILALDETLKRIWNCPLPGREEGWPGGLIDLSDIYEYILGMNHKDRDQRARRVNDLYRARPFFDESSLTFDDLLLYIRPFLPSSDLLWFLHPQYGSKLTGHMNLIEVWTAWKMSHSAGSWEKVNRCSYRVVIGGPKLERRAPIYRPNALIATELTPPEHLFEGKRIRRYPLKYSPDDVQMLSSLAHSRQYRCAWDEHVVLEPLFTCQQRPVVSHASSRLCLSAFDAQCQPLASIPGTPLSSEQMSFSLRELFDLFLLRSSTSLDLKERAQGINAIYCSRPFFDEMQLMVEDVLSLFRPAPSRTRIRLTQLGADEGIPRHTLLCTLLDKHIATLGNSQPGPEECLHLRLIIGRTDFDYEECLL